MADSIMIHHIKKVEVREVKNKEIHNEKYQTQDIILHKQNGMKVEITAFIEEYV